MWLSLAGCVLVRATHPLSLNAHVIDGPRATSWVAEATMDGLDNLKTVSCGDGMDKILCAHHARLAG